MVMPLSDIAQQTEWDDIDLGHLTLRVGLFSADVPFVLFPAPDAEPAVTQKMAATIGDVLALPPAELTRVKAMLWDEANFAFQVADYGVETEGDETPLAAHLRAFGIHTPDDAYARSTVREVHIGDAFAARYAEIKIDTGADNRISLIVKDGRLIDWDDDGTYLGWFDTDAQAAAKKRAKVLR